MTDRQPPINAQAVYSLEDLVQAERERCAVLIESLPDDTIVEPGGWDHAGRLKVARRALAAAAAAIRTRGAP